MPAYKPNNKQGGVNNLVRSVRGDDPHKFGFVRNPKPTIFPSNPGRFDFLSWTDAHSAWKHLGPSVSAEAVFLMRHRGVEEVHVRTIDIVWISTKHPRFRTHGLFDPEEPPNVSPPLDISTSSASTETPIEEPSDKMLEPGSEEYQTVYDAVQAHPVNAETCAYSQLSDKAITRTEAVSQGQPSHKPKRKPLSQDIGDETKSGSSWVGHNNKRVKQSIERFTDPVREEIVHTWDFKPKRGNYKLPRKGSRIEPVREESLASSLDKRSRGGFATAADGDFETYDAKARAAKEDEEFERPKAKKAWTRSGAKRKS